MYLKRSISLLAFLSALARIEAAPAFETYRRDSSKTNPDISVIALGLARAGTDGSNPNSDNANGFHLQEVEARIAASIDPYLRGDILLAVEKEPGEDFKLEPEEAFIETLSLPAVTVRAGKFKAYFGRQNHLHTHFLPFVDPNLINQIILGEEGINEVGVAAAYLAPLPWYSEVIVQGLSGENETLFNSRTADDAIGVFYFKNLWDLTEASTLEMDLGYGLGRNEFDGLTHISNAAVAAKWRPVERTMYRSLSWAADYLRSDREKAPADVRQGGVSSWIQWQFARRWWAQARAEYLGLPSTDAGTFRRASGLLAFVPTEYSAIRLQYDAVDDPTRADVEHRAAIQFNVSLGTHPAHQY